MNNDAELTILIDDTGNSEEGFEESFGLCVLIKKSGKKILFDLGSEVNPLLNNLLVAGVSINELDAIILSHNHFDHTGGLPGILPVNNDIPIYVHKYWDKKVRSMGSEIPVENRVVIKEGRELTELCPGIFITDAGFSEDYGGIYEQACFIQGAKGLTLLCGCCHPGLNFFLEQTAKLGLGKLQNLHIMGGFHDFTFNENESEILKPFTKKITAFH
nr:MBL fold metallo-hydrolase [Deltaproteobacteria bacterium]